MTKFGWSYPPGAANDPYAPYNQDSEPLQLHEDKTLKGYGRKGHGLNGKDADLDECGQNVVDEAWWYDDNTITIEGRRYASVCGDDDWDDDQWNVAQEIVSGEGIAGEWDGDYWVLTQLYTLRTACLWNDDETEEQNIARACKAAMEAIDQDSKTFEDAIRGIHKAFEEI